MTDGVVNDTCPVCHGDVEAVTESDLGVSYRPRLTVDRVALALDNEETSRAVAFLMPLPLRLAIAGVMLGSVRPDERPMFSEQDVEDEAEHGARCKGVAREFRARNKMAEAADWSARAERAQRRALRICNLLPDDVQLALKKRVFGDPLGGDPVIEVVKA